MFSLFKSARYTDSQLGEFIRSRGHWRGSLTFGKGIIPLIVSGNRNEPDAQAMQIAYHLPSQFPTVKAAVENALFEHYAPYAEATAAVDLPSPNQSFPMLKAADQVWPHVALLFISVTPLDGMLTTEFGYAVAWDEEHTLGARFRSDRFIELCGSVVQP